MAVALPAAGGGRRTLRRASSRRGGAGPGGRSHSRQSQFRGPSVVQNALCVFSHPIARKSVVLGRSRKGHRLNAVCPYSSVAIELSKRPRLKSAGRLVI